MCHIFCLAAVLLLRVLKVTCIYHSMSSCYEKFHNKLYVGLGEALFLTLAHIKYIFMPLPAKGKNWAYSVLP